MSKLKLDKKREHILNTLQGVVIQIEKGMIDPLSLDLEVDKLTATTQTFKWELTYRRSVEEAHNDSEENIF